MRTATGTMIEVQVPFEVDDIHDFWENHKIKKNPEDIITTTQPIFSREGFSFGEVEDHTITIYYKDHHKDVPSWDYWHWRACYYTITGKTPPG